MISAPIILRFEPHTGKWWALNRRETGWASYGYPYAYLGDALDAHHATLTGFARDQWGLYLTARRTHA